MRSILIILAGTALIAQALLGLSYFISCIWEKEKRATLFAGIQFAAMMLPLLLFFYLSRIGIFNTLFGTILLSVGIVAGVVAFFVLWARTGANQKALKGTSDLIRGEVKPFDERDHVFARNRSLRPGSEQFAAYYEKHPELKSKDGDRRNMGGPLGHPGTIDRPHETQNVAATLASLSIPLHLSYKDQVKPKGHPEFKGKTVTLSPGEASERAKGAFIAIQLAHYLANLGYSATAHHLRHYETILVPLAVDAGLGEMGRLGYLMTKQFGPRVRLGAVTTDLPLLPDKPIDIGVEHFCKICKKCAECCPSNSIPLEDQTVVNGTLRWKLNAETCFEYWGKAGTDCNICMRVCPWSHADTFPHKVIKEFVSRNRLSRHLFSKMDDIFYGRKPGSKTPLSWTQYGPWQNR